MTPKPGSMEHLTFHHQTWDSVAHIAAFSDVPPDGYDGTAGVPLGTIAVAPARSASVTGDALTLLLQLYPQRSEGPVHYIAKGADQYGLFQPDGEHLCFLVTTDQRHCATATVPDDWYDRWHSVAAVYDGTRIQLFIDGVEVACEPVTGFLRYAPGGLLFGRHPVQTGVGVGVLHRFQLYDVALAPSLLAQALNAPTPECRIDFSFDTWESFSGTTPRPNEPTEPTPWQKALATWQATDSELSEGTLTWQTAPGILWDHLTVDWEVCRDGEVKQQGTCDLNWDGATGCLSVQPGYTFPRDDAGTEYWLNLHFKEDSGEEPKSVARKQFLLPTDCGLAPGPMGNGLPPIDIHEKDNVGYFKGENFTVEIDLPTATILSWEIDGEQLLELGPIHQLWRAPARDELGDNDALATHWSVAGLAENMMGVTAMEALQDMPPRVALQFKGLIIKRDSEVLFEVAREYVVHGDGEIVLRQTLTPKAPLPPLGRIGLELRLPNDMTHVAWYGGGPGALFEDSQEENTISHYTCTASAPFPASSWPTELGHKRGVRWLTLRNSGGRGLFIGSHTPFTATVSPYSTFQLTEAMHPDCLTPDSALTVHADSWLSTPECLASLPDDALTSEIRMRGLLPEDRAPWECLKRGIPEGVAEPES